MQRKEYSGWYNYETWAVNLWIANDEHSQRQVDAQARMVWEANAPDESAAEVALADLIRADHEEAAASYGLRGVFSDLMTGALSEVNWDELAEHLIADLDKAAPAE